MITTEDIQKARGNEESTLFKAGLLRALETLHYFKFKFITLYGEKRILLK